MSATCTECGANAPTFEGYCALCLDDFAQHMSPAEKPTTSSHVIRAAYAEAMVRADAAPRRETMKRFRSGDPTLPFAWYLSAMAADMAWREAIALGALLNNTEEAERFWALWQVVQRWKAQRKAS